MDSIMRLFEGESAIDLRRYSNPTPRRNGLHPYANCGVGALVDLKGRKSHALIRDALRLLMHLEHRGARGSDGNTGDGAGLLLQKPHSLFSSQVKGLGDFDDYGVGQFFLPRLPEMLQRSLTLIEECARAEGFKPLVWREVPTDNNSLGRLARESEPSLYQAFFVPRQKKNPDYLDLTL